MFLPDTIFQHLFGNPPDVSPNRYAGLSELVTILKEGKRISDSMLDIGCGSQQTARLLQLSGVKGQYLGIDVSLKDKSAGASLKEKDFTAHFKEIDLWHFEAKERFGTILSLWNLEHMANDHGVLERMKYFKKPGGNIIMLIPSIWTWPIEFGRHGYRYYTQESIKKLTKKAHLRLKRLEPIGGVGGLVLTIVTQWLAYLVLLPVFLVLKFLGRTPRRDTRGDIGDAGVSRKVLRSTIFLYKHFKLARWFHFQLVKGLCRLDQLLKFMPLSYLVVLQ